MSKEKRKWLGILLLTLPLSGLIGSAGTYLNSIPLLILAVLLLTTLPFTAYQLSKHAK